MPSNPEVRIKEGERINFHVEATGHPFYIKTTDTTGSGDLVNGVINNGATDGTVNWTPSLGAAGTYYYKCGNHAAMGGTITVLSVAPLPGYNIDVTAPNNSGYSLSGTDRNGSVNGNDVDVTIREGDRVNFLVDASGHPFYIKTDPITGTSNQIAGVSGQGSETQTVTWIAPVGSSGTYYYQCGNHAAMSGKLIVESSSGSTNPGNSNKVSNGGPLTEHQSGPYFDVQKAGPYFTGSVPIKWSKMRQYFKEIYPVNNAVPVSASEMKRNTNPDELEPIVPNSTENEQIAATTEFNWKASQMRGSIKRYYADQRSNATELSMARFTGGNGIDWSNGGISGVDSTNDSYGNITRNVQKITFLDMISGSGDTGNNGVTGGGGVGDDKVAAARLTPSNPIPANNFRIQVDGEIYGSAGREALFQYSVQTDKTKSDPGKDGGTALKIVHTGNTTQVYVGNNAKIYGGGGGGEQGAMGYIHPDGLDAMKGICDKQYDANPVCGDTPTCNSGDTLIAQASGGCCRYGPDCIDSWLGTWCTTVCKANWQTGTCLNSVPSENPIQGKGGMGGWGAGYGYTQSVGGGPQNAKVGEDGTEGGCPTCLPGADLRVDTGLCSTDGGKGGDGGDYGQPGESTTGIDGDGGKAGAAICGAPFVLGGNISNSSIKGRYDGPCEGSGSTPAPNPNAPTVTIGAPYYVRFKENPVSHLMVSGPGNCLFRVKHSWTDKADQGYALDSMSFGGFAQTFAAGRAYWGRSYDNPISYAMDVAWSPFMREYAVFPASSNAGTPTDCLPNQAQTAVYRFNVTGGTNAYTFKAQADNNAKFSIKGPTFPGGFPLGEVETFSNPTSDYIRVENFTLAAGQYDLTVTITNSSFPAGQEPEPGANNNWYYNPGGVAFWLQGPGDTDEADEFSERDWTVCSLDFTKIQEDGVFMSDVISLPEGEYPITWTGLNAANGTTYPNPNQLSNNTKKIILFDSDGTDANQTFELWHPTLDVPYTAAAMTWDVSGQVTRIFGSSNPNDPTFSLPASSAGTTTMSPERTTTYTVNATGPGGTNSANCTIK